MLRKLFCSVLAALALALPLTFTRSVAAQELFDDAEGVETLTRGPLHEAFAEAVTYETKQTLIVAKEPPPPIDEVPPEYKPDDEDASWISGYWAWDEERDDFLWISGVWRVPPPGQRWVPGYWQTISEGYEWVPGFWVSAETTELSYLPEPPETLEAGPTSPAPSEEHFYVPGCWQYTTVGYRWQPGYWYEGYENWMWVPQRWVWTPRGVIFVNGYWDYRLPQRGFVFAPVYFTRTVWSQPQFVYRPTIVLNINTVFNHLFVRPGYRHYYFGDWYGDRYARYNIVPAYQWHVRRGGYDPLISFYTQSYRRRGEDFIALSRERYTSFVRYEDRRPAHTYREVQRRLERVENRNDRQDQRIDSIASRLDDVVRDRRSDVSFVRLREEQRTEIRERSQQLRELTRERNQLERVVDRTRGDADRGDRDNRGDREGRGERARLRLPQVAATPARTEGEARTPRNRPGHDDVPRPIAQNDPRERRDDRRGEQRDDRRDDRPGVATTPGQTQQPSGRPDRDNRPEATERPNVAQQPEGGNRDREERPQIGNRPGGDRPEVGTRPGATERPEVGARPGTTERPEVGARPGREERPDVGARPNPLDRIREERDPRVGETPRTGETPRAGETNRPGVGNRPGTDRTPEVGNRTGSGRPTFDRPNLSEEQLRRFRENPAERPQAPNVREPRDQSGARPERAGERDLRDPRSLIRPETRGQTPRSTPGQAGERDPRGERPDRSSVTPGNDAGALQRAAAARAAAERAATQRSEAQKNDARRTLRPEIPNVGRDGAADRARQEAQQRAQQQQRAAQEQAQRAQRDAQRAQQQQAERAREQQQRAAQEQAQRAQRDAQRAAQAARPERPERGNAGGGNNDRGRGRERRERDKD